MERFDSATKLTLTYAQPIREPGSGRWSEGILALADRYRRWLLLGVVVSYLIGFNGHWRVERDSALYLSIARNLAEGHGYTFRNQPNRLAFPGLPFVMAGVFRTFHCDVLRPTPALVVMLLMGFATLALTYRLFLVHSGRPTAVLMMAGLALTRVFYRYCFELMTDLPFLLGVMAFLAGYEAIFSSRRNTFEAPPKNAPSIPENPRQARWYDVALMIVGLLVAMAMRPAMWALLIAVFLTAMWAMVGLARPSVPGGARRQPLQWRHIGILAVVIAAVLAFILLDPRRIGVSGGDEYEGYLIDKIKHLRPLLSQIGTATRQMFNAALIKSLFGISIPAWLNVLAGIFILGLGVSLFRVRVLWGLWITLTVAMLLLFKPLDRYFLPVLPLLIFAWWRFLVALNYRLPPELGNPLFLLLFLTGLGTNIARIGEMAVEQRGVPFLQHYHEGRYTSIGSVARLLKQHTEEHDVVLASPRVARVMTYVAHRDVFEANDKLPAIPDYVLTGPSWEDGEGSHKKFTVPQRLAKEGLQLGPVVASVSEKKPDGKPWILYRVERKP